MDITELSDEELKRQANLGSLSDEELKALTPVAPPEKPGMLSRAARIASDTLMAVPEAATNLASRAAAGTIAFGAGAAGVALPGPPGQGADFMARAQAALPPYEPRTPGGKTLVRLADIVPNALANVSERAGQGVTDYTGSPLAGAVTQSTIEMLPTVLAGGARIPYRTGPSAADIAAVRARALGQPVPAPTSIGGLPARVEPSIGPLGNVNVEPPNPALMDLRGRAEPGLDMGNTPNISEATRSLPPRVGPAQSAGTGAAAGPPKFSAIDRLMDRGKQEALAAASRDAPRAKTLKEIFDAGYRVPPSALGGSLVVDRLEGIAGKAALSQQASIDNQLISDKMGRIDGGLGPNEPLTIDALKAASDRMAGPYREVAALSPTAAKALETLKQIRAESKAWWKNYNQGGAHPDAMKKAKELDAQAETLEGLIEKKAIGLGQADLVARLRDARVQIAQNADVQRALNTSTNEIDASVVGRMYEKDKGRRMTGALATVGKFYNNFKAEGRLGSSVPTPGVGKTEAFASAALALGGHYALGPYGLTLAALPYAAGPIRSALLSKAMQPSMSLTYKPGATIRLADLATRNPWALTAIPAIGLKPPEAGIGLEPSAGQ